MAGRGLEEPRGLEELRIASNTLCYERYMLVYTAMDLRKIDRGTRPKWIHLESFLIHARCLIDFLYPYPKWKHENGVYHDSFPGGEKWEEKIPPLLGYYRRYTHTWVAHITFDRRGVPGFDGVWPTLQIMTEIVLALDRFLELAPQSRSGARWEDPGWKDPPELEGIVRLTRALTTQNSLDTCVTTPWSLWRLTWEK